MARAFKLKGFKLNRFMLKGFLFAFLPASAPSLAAFAVFAGLFAGAPAAEASRAEAVKAKVVGAKAGGAKSGEAKIVKYELKAERGPRNLSGKKTVPWALFINDSIPAPVLEFTEGDFAEIKVTNQIPGEDLSIHWHGILLDPEMDGVPYLTTPPIPFGKSHLFRFKIRQHGTYWYHSHTSLQEQRGLYGGIVIHPRKNTGKSGGKKQYAYDKEAVAVLSDWSDEKANQIMRNLKKDGEYYRYKKNTVRSWFGAIRARAFGRFLLGEWTRMGGMDLSDVGYDAFLINGKKSGQLLSAKKGEKIRLRLINAAASSYFYVSLAGLPMKVISADGMDIQPVAAEELLLGMGETYDILFELPEQRNYEMRSTAQDATGYASGWIGGGEPAPAPDRPKPDLYAGMEHSGNKGHSGHKGHGSPSDSAKSKKKHSGHKGHGSPSDSAKNKKKHSGHKGHGSPSDSAKNKKKHSGHKGHNSHKKSSAFHSASPPSAKKTAPSPLKLLTVSQIQSLEKTSFPRSFPRHDLKLILGGDMERYVWHINGKAIHQDQTIKIKKGDVIRFIFENKTMMNHPMHLHGHFFRVLGQGKGFSPLKHTVDVPPHGKRIIEFLANEPGEWLLHCHNLYHMKTGMARIIRYSGFSPKPEIAKLQGKNPMLQDDIYFSGELGLATNQASLSLSFSRTWDSLAAELETHSYKNLDSARADLFYEHWLGRFFHLIAGGLYDAEYESGKIRGVLGFGYTLPLLIEAKALIDHKGKFRFDLEKRFQWTKYVFSEAEAVFRQGEKIEFDLTLMYAHSPVWALGLVLTEDSCGAGAHLKF